MEFLSIGGVEGCAERVVIGKSCHVMVHPVLDSLDVFPVHVDFTVGHHDHNVPFLIPHCHALVFLECAAHQPLLPIFDVLCIGPLGVPTLPEVPPHLEPILRTVYSNSNDLQKWWHRQTFHKQNANV